MKKYLLVVMVGLLSMSCNAQNEETTKKELKNETQVAEDPKGTWKVDKEFDEQGNLIRYDSIYSWSSTNQYDHLSAPERDSLMQSFKSRFFTNLSPFEKEGFSAVFSQDSLFSNHFFNDNFFESNFGQDFIDIDKISQEMIERQRAFLEKYQSEFVKPEDEN